MGDQSVAILCGKCNVSVEGPAEPDGDAIYTCPSCGNSDAFENVMASVKAFSEEMISHSFHESATNSFRGSKLIEVTSKPTPKRFHPFITDMKL